MRTRKIKVGSEALGPDQLKKIRDQFYVLLKEDRKKEIVLLFDDCEGGGNLEEVLELICSMLEEKVPIRTVNRGFIISTASILFLVGDPDKRAGTVGCKFNFHPVSVVLKELRLDQLHSDFVVLEGEVKRLGIMAVDFIESRTLLQRQEIIRLFSTRHEAWDFDLEAALRFGLVSQIATKT